MRRLALGDACRAARARGPAGELLSLPLPACRGEPAALPQLGAVVLECSSTCLNCSAWRQRAV